MPSSAWISSTITCSQPARIARPRVEVSSRYSDSGVVISRCGGCRKIRARSVAVESPVRSAVRIVGVVTPSSVAAAAIPRSGACRLRSTSAPSALSGDTYTILTPSPRVPAAPRRTSPSMPAKNAASVFPEPVGAMISASWPAAIAAQPPRCASVGPAKRPSNHRCTGAQNWPVMGATIAAA